MKLQLVAPVISALALALAAAPADAGAIPTGGVTASEIAAWLKGKGHNAEVRANHEGKTTVSAEANGFHLDVYFYDCEGARCGSIQYVGYWPLTADLSKINEYNEGWRFLRLYANDYNVVGEYDVEVQHSTWEQLDVTFATFLSMIPGVTNTFGKL